MYKHALQICEKPEDLPKVMCRLYDLEESLKKKIAIGYLFLTNSRIRISLLYCVSTSLLI